MLQENIDLYKALVTEDEKLKEEYNDLNLNRIPELTTKIRFSESAVENAKLIVKKALTDDELAIAKATLKSKEETLQNTQILYKNSKVRLNEISHERTYTLSTKIKRAADSMWKIKRDELLSSLPDMTPEDKLTIERLAAIDKRDEAFPWRQNLYGRIMNEKHGQVDNKKSDEGFASLKLEMGI